MTRKIFIIISFFFLTFLLTGCQPEISPKIIPSNNPKIITDSPKLTPEELITKYKSCEIDSDCGQVTDPGDFCCGSIYTMNKKGIKEYREYFAEEFKKKNEKCDKEEEKGLSCSMWQYEPVCVDKICKWKYMDTDKDEIIENKFISNPYFPGDDL
ncbi:MAG: hypothetical protein WA055_05080 [Candidatus Moraniibacteriota bacterium]